MFLTTLLVGYYIGCKTKADLALCPGREVEYLLNGQRDGKFKVATKSLIELATKLIVWEVQEAMVPG